MHLLFKLLLTLLLALALTSMAGASTLAGKVQFVVGSVSATAADGKVRQLKKGDWIYAGDRIKSGPEGSAQLIFKDRSRLAVRVNTEFTVDTFSFDKKNTKTSKSQISLVTGALRAVTGLIGSDNKNNVSIKTPITTIGIRGTDHEIIHINGDLKLDKASARAGTYNRVYAGATFMQTPGGEKLLLNLNDVGFVGGSGGKVLKPVKIKVLPPVIEKQLIHKVQMMAKKRPLKPGPQNANFKGQRQGLVKRPLKPGMNKPAVTGLKSYATLANPKTLSPVIGTSTFDATKSFDSTLPTTTLESTKTLDSTLTTSTIDSTRTFDSTLSTTTLDATKTLDTSTATTIDATKTLDTTKTISPTLILTK